MRTKIITCNTNGIRSAARKGFFQWLQDQDADVVCIQEIRAQQQQLEDEVFYPCGLSLLLPHRRAQGLFRHSLVQPSHGPTTSSTSSVGTRPIPKAGIYRWTSAA